MIARTAFAHTNPVARLGASMLLAIALVVTIDPVSAGTALVLELALVPATGIGWRRFWRRTWPIWLAAPLSGVTILLYGRPSGEVHWQWLAIQVSDGSILLAIATTLRVLAIALPAVVLFAATDPTDLADGLAQVAHLPSRFVLGALAGLRMLGLFREDYRSLERARRARGVADRGRIRRFGGLAFALLVLSIRRGTALATAMEARGFGGPVPRTWARESRLGPADAVLVLIVALVGAVALTAAVLTGAFTPVLR